MPAGRPRRPLHAVPRPALTREQAAAALGPLPTDRPDVTDEPLMKVPEAQRMLNVSRGWLYDAAKAGRVPHVRLGGPDGPLRFVRSDLEDYIDDARRGWRPNAATLSRTS